MEIDNHDSSEAEPLLNEAWQPPTDEALSASTISMGTRDKAPPSSHKAIANILDGGTELVSDSSPHSQHLFDSANLRAQGHEAALQRSFSPLAALGLGFRYTMLSSKQNSHD